MLSITLAVGLATGLVGRNGGKKAESIATQTASIQAESAQEAAKVPGTAKEVPKAKGGKRGSEAQTTGNNGQAAPVKTPGGFPSKDTTLVNPYEAGGTSGIPTRIYAGYISGIMDGVIVNVTGVTRLGGAVDTQWVMSSPGDGCTLLVVPADYAIQYAKGSYEFTYGDFKPVSLLITSYLGVTVNTSSGIKTYEDLVQAAKDRPGKLKFDVATSGLLMFCALTMGEQEGVGLNIVDIGGTTLKAPEPLNDRIDAMIGSLAGLTSYVNSGNFTILGLYADDRLANYPDVPTFAELGYETNVMNQVFGIWVPRDTPDNAVEYFSSLFGVAAADEGIQKQPTDLTYSAGYVLTAEYITYLEKMYTDPQKFAKELN